MVTSRAAAFVDQKILGRAGDAITTQDVSNPSLARQYGEAGETMKALCWMGKNKVQLLEVPKPKIIEDRDVILQVTGTTVCGSDLHLLHGTVLDLQKGDILGHEFCGVVESKGAAVGNLEIGDRVVASFQIACGECLYCKRGLSSQCDRTNASKLQEALYGTKTAGLFGYSHLTGGFAGGQAEYVRVPLGDVNLLKLPDDVPDEKGLFLSDVIPTSWHCVVDTGVEKGDVVAIWGAGPIGQMACDFSFQHGASRVIMIDSNFRLDLIKRLYPRAETLNYSALPFGCKTVPEALRQIVPGGVDVALECVAGEYAKGWAHYVEMLVGAETDTSEIINEMLLSVKGFGRCGITGVYVGFTNHFNIGALMERGIRLIGNGQAPVHKYWHDLLGRIQSGEIDPLRMVSHRVSLDEMEKVYQKFEKKEDGMQKVFVQTRFSAPPAPGAPPLTTLD